jgi:NAD+-dependent farnesol dehydrogenase
MKIFITGGSGFIGQCLAEKLASDNHDVTVLIRDTSKSDEFLKKGIHVIAGDIFNTGRLKTGMVDCDWVFHLAAYTKPSSKDPDLPYRTNVTGTVNVLDAARENGVKRVILTSTAGTMSYSQDGFPVDEETNINPGYNTEYERTKSLSEKTALNYPSDNMDIIIVNPTRVYGPGKLSISNSVTKIIKLYARGIWRIIPGDGKAIGNYVFIDDVVYGHILAARFGVNGERYILGGENLSYNDFFRVIDESSGRRRINFSLRESSLKLIVRLTRTFCRLTGTPEVLNEGWIDKYLKNWIVSSSKAQSRLGYKITPFAEGIKRTLVWLKSNKKHYD